MAFIYLLGICSTLFYNMMMVSISQGVLKTIRIKLFNNMQNLPIKYFDTHSQGDVMSYYTNDIDTLRQVLSQSIPQVFSSIITIAAVFFVKQQSSIGTVNGYIEEMIASQKVVKVFCHEEKAKQEFDTLNNQLFNNANEANKYTNILKPIMQNSQISQQLNVVVMALAGAKRIFSLMDEEPEQDNGYVTLVNATNKNSELVEVKEHTGTWAWKHPHEDGIVTYTLVKGGVQLYDVDFEYTKDKPILHDITLYAQAGQKIAFVGSTGAGKTTITNLINRFYDIADGKIRYDSININNIKKSDLRRSLGVVLQDTNLFAGIVKENILYGKLDATTEEVIAASKFAKHLAI